MDMTNLILFLLMGFIFGMLTGFLGIGGGFLMTPALNILGFQMVYAIGTSFATIAGNTLIGAIRHYGFGNVDLKIGIIMGLFSIIGVDFGKRLVFYFERLNLADTYVRMAYIFLLLFISIFVLKEYFQYIKPKEEKTKSNRGEVEGKKSSLGHQIRRINIPPRISFSRSGVNPISVWGLIIFGVLIGFLSGFMGVGGGFVSLPLLIYGIGLPTLVAIGTSLVNVFFTSFYGMIVYAAADKVEWLLVLIILVGSLFGVQFGIYATKYVSSMKIRVLFALFLFMIAVSIILKQLNRVIISRYLLLGSASALSLAILLPFVKRVLGKVTHPQVDFPGNEK